MGAARAPVDRRVDPLQEALLHRPFRFALLLLAALALGAADKPVPPAGPADQTLGRADAPITVIEYGSLTCPHCAAFELTILPRLKSDWIETGKIRFVFRDLPRDQVDLLAFQFAHCSGDQRFWAFLDSLFRSQSAWVPAPSPAAHFVMLGRLAGLGEAKVRACLADQSLARASAASGQSGHDSGVDSTPTFFLDGRKIEPFTYEDWQRVLSTATGQN
jgi:protein-disulfide isomerase